MSAPVPSPPRWQGIVADWSGDRVAFQVPWGKAMMWVFLLSDTFIFGCFLTGYMAVRIATTVPWPVPSVVFGLEIGGASVPLLLIAIMTFILISSSGTMAMAVHFAYRRDRVRCAALMLATATLGACFVGMQTLEWSKLILEGVRPWSNPWGAPQFGAAFFMITGFHGLHVTVGVIYLVTVATRVLRGRYEGPHAAAPARLPPAGAAGRLGGSPSPPRESGGNYGIVEIAGLYWHFVDLVWVFIFAFFYLW